MTWKRFLLAGFVVGVIVTAVIFYVRDEMRYYANFHYDLQSNYIYSFPQEATTPVILTQDGFLWPALKSQRDTAFLKIDVRSDWSSIFLKPYIEIQWNGVKRRQYFEKTAKGIRYLNLSSLAHQASAVASGDPITLVGHHISWEQGATEFYSFQNKNLHKARILVIAPHPDDAELAAFGLYENKDAYIVTLTAGEGGKMKYTTFFPEEREHAIFQGAIRTWDSLTVPFWGNIPQKQCLCLGYFDGTLKEMFQTPAKKVSSRNAQTSDVNVFRKYNVSDLLPKEIPQATWNDLVADLSRLLTTIDPDIIVTPNLLTEGHPDHQFATVAVLEALKKAGTSKGSLYLYTIHNSFTSRWPFGTAKSLVSLPPYFSKEPFFEKIYVENLSLKSFTRKYFAFDDMHDLRPVYFLSPSQYGQAFPAALQAFYVQWKAALMMRKYLRNQELFFVAPVAKSQLLQEEFLRNPPLDN